MVRSYNHKHYLNSSKEADILLILEEYRRVAKIILDKQLVSFFKTGSIDTTNFYKDIKSSMTERWKDICKRQVDGMLKSYISNRKHDFKKMINKSSLSEQEKIELRTVNKYNLWFRKDNFLARKVMKMVLSDNKFPTVKNINMMLNTKVYRIEESECETFKYWIRLSTFKRAQFIYIPIKENSYFEKQKGTLKNAIQLNFDKKKLSNIVFMLDKNKSNDVLSDRSISIDIGLRNLITTNNGDLFGQDFINKLYYYDNKILKLQKDLQRRGIKPKSNNRFNALVKSQKSYIKNECNRVINRIVKLYNPSEINIENLSFKSTKVRKRINRLLHNFGIGIIKTKLKSLKEERGLTITEVNPAYTSQECSKCHNIDKKNRRGENFKCTKCGYKAHADINSTKVINRRSKDERISIYTPYKEVYRLLTASQKRH